MTQKRTTPVEAAPVRVVVVTLDRHLGRVVANTEARLRREIPGMTLTLHAASEWERDPAALARAQHDVGRADIVIATMLFLEDQIRAIRPALEARREQCDAMVVAMSAGDVIKLTKLGAFRMDAPQTGPLALLKRLRGNKAGSASSGAGQMAMLRRLPKILRFIPGKAQDVRAYFLTLQYWLAGSDANMAAMIRMLINRYASGARQMWRGAFRDVPEPADYPEVGVYHPALPGRIAERADALPAPAAAKGTVGLLILRSYILAEDTGHYDGVIRALEAKGLRVIPAFASGLDARPAVDRFFRRNGKASVDAVVSLTGFSLVGGPAYNDSRAAEESLASLDVPYIAAQAVEFQTIEAWAGSSGGLSPVESTIMVAIPELDGATAPLVYGGRARGSGEPCTGCGRKCTFEAEATPQMRACDERAEALAARVARTIALRRTVKAERRIAIVLFNFPPNAGAAGTAAYLSVFASLRNTLSALAADGYAVNVPHDADELRRALLEGNAARWGTDANVHALVSADDHVRQETYLAEIERAWGAAPGRHLSDGRNLFIMGARFGNVFVGLQPGMGTEGDPMRLLFDGAYAPTHAFSAFYRWLRSDFGAHAVLHFGTHGALEFMPGKQVGLTGSCWPERLIGDLPNLYLYAANNPSEGAIAKRRAAATLVSYMTPPVSHAGLYRGLQELKASLDRWRASPPDAPERPELQALIQEQCAAVDVPFDPAAWLADAPQAAGQLAAALYEIEQALIPAGLHVIGEAVPAHERSALLTAMAGAQGHAPAPAAIEAVARGDAPQKALAKSGLAVTPDTLALFQRLAEANRHLMQDAEMRAILHALDGGYVRPSPGGDVLHNPDVLPTGRNIHGFDPFKLPSAFALKDGARQAQRLLDRHCAGGKPLPETVAVVLWGTDNLKSEGGPIGQVLALMGARPRFDSYGRLSGAELIPLTELGRPRIDVVVTLSGIFRDLLPLQTKLIAEAAWLAASADEPEDRNFVRRHALAHQAALGCDLETAALRVFSNADGAYGANVNQLIDSGAWGAEDELADAYESRKSFAYGRTGQVKKQSDVLRAALAHVDLAYQNLDSMELGITTIDHYVDTLGGISRAVRRVKGSAVDVYVSDQTQGTGKIRTLAEQVTLETRTRTLNPRWYEGLLKHGYEGVRQIEAQVTNTMGWSATAGEVPEWVYQRITETYVLDPAMRDRLATLNPKASARLANRLIEAHERKYWSPDAATLEALRQAGDELEDRLEGVSVAAE